MPENSETRSVIPSLGLPTPTTPGEIGVAGLGLAAGYLGGLLIALRFPQLGATPGAVSVYVSAAAIGCKNLVQAYLNARAEAAQARLADPLVWATKMFSAIDREIGLGRMDTAPQTGEQARIIVALEHDKASLADTVELYSDGLVSGEGLRNAIKNSYSDLMNARRVRQDTAKGQAISQAFRSSRGVDTELQNGIRKVIQPPPSNPALDH